MTKNDFVELVKTVGEYESKKEAIKAIESFTIAVEKALANGEEVTLAGFGSFKASLLKGKEGKVPGTDKTYKTEDKMVPKFKAGKGLKDKVATLKVK